MRSKPLARCSRIASPAASASVMLRCSSHSSYDSAKPRNRSTIDLRASTVDGERLRANCCARHSFSIVSQTFGSQSEQIAILQTSSIFMVPTGVMAPDLTATASGGQLLYQRDVRVWPRTLRGPQAAKDSRIGNRSAAGVKGDLIAHHEHIVWGVPLLGEQDPDEPLREHRSSGDHSFTITFDAYYEAVSQTVARRDRLDTVIEDLAANSSFTPMVNRFGCLRGVSALTGLALAVEIGDWHRFTGKTIGSFVGLVPSEYSSGQSRSQGGITKTGNSHVRRLLVEAAWQHRRDYSPSRQSVSHARWEKASAPARLRGQDGNQRLHRQWVAFTARRKRPVVANTAIARELAGWCWSLAVMDD